MTNIAIAPASTDAQELTRMERIGSTFINSQELIHIFEDLAWTTLSTHETLLKEWLVNFKPERQLELFWS